MSRLSREEARIQTRTRIRRAAASAFARHGVGAASIDGIAEAAGYSRGAFYSNYADKRDVLLELLTEAHFAEVAVWAGLIEQACDLNRLMAELAARFDAYLGHADLGVLSIELQLEARRDETFARVYRESDARLMGTVEKLLQSLFAKAGRAPAPDVATLARTLRALTAGLVLQENGPACLKARAGSVVTRYLLCMLGLPAHDDLGEQI